MSTGGFDWRRFLEEYNREILSTEEARRFLPADVLASGWLGFSGASEEEILAAEKRLKVELPPTYRSFLATSNGWHIPSYFVYELWPTSRITWFSENHQDWIDAYVQPAKGSRRLSDEEYLIYGEKQSSVHFREDYLQSALQISELGDSAVMLLNPAIKTSLGEWEAWLFANWYPGAVRFRSFSEMMEHERKSFLELQREQPEQGTTAERPHD